MRTCKKCCRDLPIEKFPLNVVKGKEYRGYTCMVCWRYKYLSKPGKREIHKEGSKNWYYSNPEKAKTQRLRKYGIDYDQYNLLREKQKYRCAICQRHETEVEQGRAKTTDTALYVDHCHQTMKVRGLLCTNCNTMIGKSKDDVEVLKAAIKYLEDNCYES